MLNFTAPPPLSLYIHIPWCVRKCPYCDFNSHAFHGELPEKRYIQTLLSDLNLELPYINGREIVSIFIGGGTPSLFSAESIDYLLSGIRSILNLKPDIEITLEANPGTTERVKLAEFCSCSVNRLSLGIQSFNDDALQKLGRIHTGNEARLAIEAGMQAGFDSINIDLMYGLPGQLLEQALFDLEAGISYQPQHISHYQLTIEPDTAFYRRPPILPGEDKLWRIQSDCQQKLLANGFTQYEVSAWSKDNKQCQHNLNYWLFGDYLGIGAGAHQKLTITNKQEIRRRCKQKTPATYFNSVPESSHVVDDKSLTCSEIVFEFMINALRLTQGFTVREFERHTGLPINEIKTELNKAEKMLLLRHDNKKVVPTDRGRRYLNDLLLLFVPD